VKWTITPDRTGSATRLTITTTEPVEGLTFESRRNIKSVDRNATIKESGHQMVVHPLKAGESITIEIRYL
jgi:hypothetical protein